MKNRKHKKSMKRITIGLMPNQVKNMDKLIALGIIPNRSEGYRVAIRGFLLTYNKIKTLLGFESYDETQKIT